MKNMSNTNKLIADYIGLNLIRYGKFWAYKKDDIIILLKDWQPHKKIGQLFFALEIIGEKLGKSSYIEIIKEIESKYRCSVTNISTLHEGIIKFIIETKKPKNNKI
jgi:hypothetical protein